MGLSTKSFMTRRSLMLGFFICVTQLIHSSQQIPSSTETSSASSPRFISPLEKNNLTAVSCTDLKHSIPRKIRQVGVEVYVSELHGPGNFSTPDASVRYSAVVPNLPQFCRFGAFFNTSSQSRVQFEVWLPMDDWSGRMAFVGNGGDAGGVNYPDMGIPLAKYKFAVVSTDTGHNGTDYDGTFVISNPNTQYDFGYRAVHLTTVFSKIVVESFYGQPPKKNYWLGCSMGGRQGLKEAQEFPEDFDGILAGAAAQWWTHLCGWEVESNLRNDPKLEGHLRGGDWELIHEYTIKMCDSLDGVNDGIITNPLICKPKLESLLCTEDQLSLANSNTTKSTCLTKQRIAVANSIFSDWFDDDGKLLFPSFFHGSEVFGDNIMTGVPFGPGPDFFKYQVLNFTKVDAQYQFTSSELRKLVKLADHSDPGQTNAINGNILPFIKRGGKLMTYVGMADSIIPSGSSIWYYEQVKKALQHDPRDSYRLFAVPGMGHCGGGAGATNMGAASQGDASSAYNLQSASFDAQHDMILALIEWTENGKAPDEIITTKFVDDISSNPIQFQRKLCPWPLLGRYNSGNPNLHQSYTCQAQ